MKIIRSVLKKIRNKNKVVYEFIFDAVIEYTSHGLNLYAVRDLVILLLFWAAYLAHMLKKIKIRALITLATYCVIICITSEIFTRPHNNLLEFESYLYDAQLVLLVLSFTIGFFIRPWHMLVIVAYNFVFVLVCGAMMHWQYPIEKLAYVLYLFSASGIIGYAAFDRSLSLQKRIVAHTELIRRKNVQLKNMNEFKDNLFKVIGHDLRGPIYQIHAIMDILEGENTEEEKNEYLGYIRVASQNASKLLEDLLQWAKEQQSAGLKEFITQEFNVRDLVDRTIHFFEPDTSKKRLYLINATGENHKVAFDSKTMETVIRNLVSNAIKYSPKGNIVSITSRLDDDYLMLSVSNKGENIKEETLKKLGKGVMVQSTSGTMNEKGTGSGLGICKKLLDKYQGRLEIKNHENNVVASVFVPRKIELLPKGTS